MKEFGFLGFFWRWLPAFLLLAAVYNPLGYSFSHWVKAGGSIPLQVLAGVGITVGIFIYIFATVKAMGWFGTILLVLIFGVLIWVFMELGWLVLDSPGDFTWLFLIIGASILAIGMSWAGIWRRLTGQVATDSLDDNE